ncbi:SLAM family member 9-like [Conger conger]|uniref:SLAM family member 9-like n=1 Tax=Conger conger TaxID=82655 RepID=UPI002A5AA49B|nr:SLAM family member 9-like [Conger conger]
MTTQCQPFKMSRRIHVEAMLLCLIVCQCRWCEAVVERGATFRVKVGDSISFPVSPESDHIYTVHRFLKRFAVLGWHHRSLVDVKEPYRGRVSIDNKSIWLHKLNLSDSGPYEVRTGSIYGGSMQLYTDFHVQVFEPVSKPNITAECLGNNVSVSCFSQGTNVTYSWETLPPCGDDSCVRLGQTIHPLPPSTTFTCTAYNPVSNASSVSTHLEKCSTRGLQGGWIPALCVTSIVIVFGVLLLLLYIGKSGPIQGTQRGWSIHWAKGRNTPWTGRQSTLLPTDNLDSPVSRTCTSLECGRKPEHLEESYADTGGTCKLHREAPADRHSNPGPPFPFPSCGS